MDVFERLKSMLQPEAAPAQSEPVQRQERNIVEEIRKFAEKVDTDESVQLKAAVESIKYLLAQNAQLQQRMAEINKKAEAYKLAKSLVDRGVISYRDFEKRAEEISQDIEGWRKAIDLIGTNSFGDRALKFEGPSNADPLYKILLEEVGNG